MDSLVRALSVVFGTKSWFRGLEDYLDRMKVVIDEGHPEALKELMARAEEEGWEYSDVDVGCQELERQYKFEFPRILAFSTITLTYSVFESRLAATADLLSERDGHALRISHFRGDAMDRAKIFFGKVLNVPISADQSWQHLRDLEFLRHRIVHRAGKVGEDKTARDRLLKIQKRTGRLVRVDENLGGPLAELKIDLEGCRHYIREAHGFFDRVFQQTGLLTI